MIQRSTFAIDPTKGADFKEFIKKNAKDKKYWDEIKKVASRPVDKTKLEMAFNSKEKNEL